MASLSLRKVISFVVLFSLVLQSCMPVSLSIANPVFSNTSKNNYPKVEPGNYQPPAFERPEPRMGNRWESLPNSKATDSSQKFITTPVVPTTSPEDQDGPATDCSNIS
jgi:hypothetical protein